MYPVHVDGAFGPASEMRQKVLDGEPCDVVILTDVIVGELVRSGHVVDASEGSLGFVATALAQLRGAGAPAPATAEELQRLLEGASALHVPDLERSTAGRHVAEVLRRLELWEALAPRVVETAEGGQAAMRKLAESGDAAALGCTQVTEILAVPGVEVVGELPPGYRLRTSYVAAVCARAADPERALELVQALAGTDTAALRQDLGFIDAGNAATVSNV